MRTTDRTLLALVPLFLMACSIENAFDGDRSMTVHAVIRNNATGTGLDKPVPGLSVRINRGTATDAYLYALPTDQEGACTFHLLDDGAFVVFAEKVVDGARFTGVEETEASDTDVTLRLELDQQGQNGLVVRTVDAQGRPIRDVQVCAYLSQYLVNDTTCTNATLDGATAANGATAHFNIADGRYYIRIHQQVNGVAVNATDSVDVATTGISELTMTILP
ncbi:MAG: hypothetical protein H6595_09950 [Flavobacteriales bacterium]|nr:hypothetical protein [Flavobacteriales bacterium]